MAKIRIEWNKREINENWTARRSFDQESENQSRKIVSVWPCLTQMSLNTRIQTLTRWNQEWDDGKERKLNSAARSELSETKSWREGQLKVKVAWNKNKPKMLWKTLVKCFFSRPYEMVKIMVRLHAFFPYKVLSIHCHRVSMFFFLLEYATLRIFHPILRGECERSCK